MSRTGPRLALLALLALAGCVDDFPAVTPLSVAGDATVDRGGDGPAEIDRGRDGDVTPDMADAAPPDLGPDQGCVPGVEACNGRDDDCDGTIDEVAGLGEPCTAGQGACEQPGTRVCDLEAGALICGATAGEMFAERCNGVDDDCDGVADEGLGLGEACTVGLGICAAAGIRACNDAAEVVCDGVEGLPADEACNRVDDDCDGLVDEGFGIGEACSVGTGACARQGAIACIEASATCDAVAGEPTDEACNEIDDDCDGDTDEDTGFGDVCEEGIGECLRAGALICADDGGTLCGVEIGAPSDELCNDLDDDCDGETDEDFPLGERCEAGIGECLAQGRIVCADGATACDAIPYEPAPETCDGRDEDCDGRVDEGAACADFVIDHCRLWLGWRDNHAGELAPLGTWGDCPGDDSDQEGDSRCNSTRGNENYQSVALNGGMDGNDLLGMRFACSGGGGVSRWIQDNCRVSLAYGDVAAAADLERLDPRACEASWAANGLARDCVATGQGGRFHPIRHTGTVNDDDRWAIAFTCDAEDLPDRAAGIQASIAVHLALQFRAEALGFCVRGRIDDAAEWRRADRDPCPLVGTDRSGYETCASSSGDGAFHAFGPDEGGQLGYCWAFGVALKRL